MPTISNTPRPGYVYDSTDGVWYPIGTGTHSHSDYITSASAINPNIVDAKGDIIAATAADTVSKLTVGANDTVLTADSSTATGLKWATPSSGGMTLLSTTTLSGTSTTISGISGAYNDLLILVVNTRSTTTDGDLQFDPNATTGISYLTGIRGTTVGSIDDLAISMNRSAEQIATSQDNPSHSLYIYNYASASYNKPFVISGNAQAGTLFTISGGGSIRTTSAITSMRLKFRNGQTFAAGTVLIYGVK